MRQKVEIVEKMATSNSETEGEKVMIARMKMGAKTEEVKAEVRKIEEENDQQRARTEREEKRKLAKRIDSEKENLRNKYIGTEKEIVGMRKRKRPGGKMKYRERKESVTGPVPEIKIEREREITT